MAFIEILFYAAIALQILDVATTYHALTAVKGLQEANGFMAKIMDRIGLIPTLAIKLAVAAGILWSARGSDSALIILGGACALYVLIVGNNILVIRRAESK